MVISRRVLLASVLVRNTSEIRLIAYLVHNVVLFLLLMGFGILGKVNSSISSLSEFLHDNVLRVDRIRRIGHILKTIADQLQIRIFGTKPYRHQRYPIALCAEG